MRQQSAAGFAVLLAAVFSVPGAFALDEAAQMEAAKPALVGSKSAPAPQVIYTDGVIKSLNLQGPDPKIQVTAADGKELSASLDLKSSMIWEHNKIVNAAALKAGQRVKVRHMIKSGKEFVKSIELI